MWEAKYQISQVVQEFQDTRVKKYMGSIFWNMSSLLAKYFMFIYAFGNFFSCIVLFLLENRKDREGSIQILMLFLDIKKYTKTYR